MRSAATGAPSQASAQCKHQSLPPKELLRVLISIATDPGHSQPSGLLADVCATVTKRILASPSARKVSLELLGDASLRTGVFSLLAYAVRNATVRSSAAWQEWVRAVSVGLALLVLALGKPAQKGLVSTLQLDLVGIIVRTDLLASLSQLMASMDVMPTAVPGNALLYQRYIQKEVTKLLNVLLHMSSGQRHSEFRRCGLPNALLSSRLLELTARATVASFTFLPSALSVATADTVNLDQHCRAEHVGLVWRLRLGVAALTTRLEGADNSTRRWAAAMLSGPCIQHLLLVHAVTQLCAADGGPRYGLPPEVDPPVIYVDPRDPGMVCTDREVLQALPTAVGTSRPQRAATTAAPAAACPSRGDSSGGAGGGGGGIVLPELAVGGLLDGLKCWRHALCAPNNPERQPPVSRRAIRELCIRTANAANEAMEEGIATLRGRRQAVVPAPPPPMADGGAAAAAGPERVVWGQPRGRMKPSDCPRLAVSAMSCAMRTYNGPPRPGIARLWPPLVRTVNNVVELEKDQAGIDSPEHTLGLLLSVRMLPEVVPALPLHTHPHPAPPLAAALAAGYVPCVEKFLRRTFRAPVSTTVSAGVRAPAQHFWPFDSLAGLLLFGEPRSTAGLMVTGSKLLRRAETLLAPQPLLFGGGTTGRSQTPGSLTVSLPVPPLERFMIMSSLVEAAAHSGLPEMTRWWGDVTGHWEEAGGGGDGGPGGFWWLAEDLGRRGAAQAGPQGPAVQPCSGGARSCTAGHGRAVVVAGLSASAAGPASSAGGDGDTGTEGASGSNSNGTLGSDPASVQAGPSTSVPAAGEEDAPGTAAVAAGERGPTTAEAASGAGAAAATVGAAAATAATAAGAAGGSGIGLFRTPVSQALTLTSFMMSQWLPVAAALATRSLNLAWAPELAAFMAGPSRFAYVSSPGFVDSVLVCAPWVAVAGLVCSERATGAAGAAGVGTGEVPGSASVAAAATAAAGGGGGDGDGGCGDGGGRRMAEAAASWRQLLLRDMDVFEVLRAYLCCSPPRQHSNSTSGDTGGGGGENDSGRRTPDLTREERALFLLSLLALLAREETAAFLREPLVAPGQPALPVRPRGMLPLDALLFLLGAPEGRHKQHMPLARALVEVQVLPERVAADLVRGAMSDSMLEELRGAERVARLLPPPCAAVAAVAAGGLRTCSNPRCGNLGKDSEAELGHGLSRCSGACGGAAAYCGRECQVAHWRAGHKDECAKRGEEGRGGGR